MLRILGEDNEFTNQGWLSDKGRYNFDFLHSENRVLNILNKSEDSFNEISIAEATVKIKDKINELDNPNIKFLIGSHSTNPELNNFLVIPLFLRTNNKRKIDPRNVLIPTSESGLISDVLIIRGIVPQEIAKRLIKK